MSTASNTTARVTNPDIATGVLIRFAQIAAGFGFEALILFVGVGRLEWIWAWVFLAINLVSVTINATLISRSNLETIAERGRGLSQMKDRDKVVAGFWSAAQYVGLHWLRVSMFGSPGLVSQDCSATLWARRSSPADSS